MRAVHVIGFTLMLTMFGLFGFFVASTVVAREDAADALAAQLAQGEAQYGARCAVCHGAQGGGLAEARQAFPRDHQQCERCHRPGNPSRMAALPFRDNDMFAVGDAPAIIGEGALVGFPSAQSLYGYVRATMPRHDPGALDDEVYLALTAFLLERQGRGPREVLTP